VTALLIAGMMLVLVAAVAGGFTVGRSRPKDSLHLTLEGTSKTGVEMGELGLYSGENLRPWHKPGERPPKSVGKLNGDVRVPLSAQRCIAVVQRQALNRGDNGARPAGVASPMPMTLADPPTSGPRATSTRS
jgi:hypothetical protein